MTRANERTRIHVERQCFIPLAKHRLVEVLLAQLEGEQRDLFEAFCRLIESIYHFEYYRVASQLKEDYEFFGDASQPPPVGAGGEPEIRRAEDRFLSNFFTLMEKGNFRLLSQRDIDVAEEEEYLFNLPVVVDWEKLDDALLSGFFSRHPRDGESAELPRFANRILIFQRGVGVDRTVGFHLLQKIDVILTRWLRRVWGGIQWVMSWFRRAPASDDAADEQRGAADEPVAAERTHCHPDRYVERISLRSAAVRVNSLWEKTLLQEPTFEELVILYRLHPLARDEAGADVNPFAIHIKAFRQIPMADLEVVFPEKRISMKPIDLAKLVISGAIGVIVVALKLLLAGAINPLLALAAFASIGGYAAKVFMGYKVSQDRYQHLVTQSLYHKNLDNDAGVMFYLLDSLEDQEFKEAVLAYFVLLRDGDLTEKELDRRCEVFLKEQFDATVDFEIDDALGKLVRDGLVRLHEGRYSALRLDEALRTLDRKWDNYFQFNTACEWNDPADGLRVPDESRPRAEQRS